MGRTRDNKGRQRVGRVSYYFRHGAWHVYYRDGGRQVRRRVGQSEQEASQVAAQVNAQLVCAIPTPFSFTPVSVPELRRRFLEHHELALRSSLATVRRYRAATQHLEDFANQCGRKLMAHELAVEAFVRHLRTIHVAPNGHPHTTRRPLRDKGVRFVLEVCRSLYGFAAKQRHLPPYAENPFAGLGGKRVKVEDAKPVFVFGEPTELAFLKTLDDWAFPIHFTLAKTGLRPGELIHCLVEDLDLDEGWLHVRNKPELGWQIKTRRQRSVPLIPELVAVLRRTLQGRTGGPVFQRMTFNETGAKPVACTRIAMLRSYERRLANLQPSAPRTRESLARLYRDVWRDAGAIRAEALRKSFLRGTAAIDLAHVTCPKTWRHTFATLLQDANVDPLIRQLTLGHQPIAPGAASLGMTSTYTHTRPETLRSAIERALRHWPASLELARRWASAGG